MLDTLLEHDVKELSVKSAYESSGDAIFIDVREKKEYDVSHIKNALWCGWDNYSMSRLKDVPRNGQLIIYCSVGYRSEIATRYFPNADFRNVSNLYGGIFEWINQGYPVYNNAGIITTQVHAYSREWGQWLTKGKKVFN